MELPVTFFLNIFFGWLVESVAVDNADRKGLPYWLWLSLGQIIRNIFMSAQEKRPWKGDYGSQLRKTMHESFCGPTSICVCVCMYVYMHVCIYIYERWLELVETSFIHRVCVCVCVCVCVSSSFPPTPGSFSWSKKITLCFLREVF